MQDGMNIDSMFVASDIWPQLSGSDHCPSWADVVLDSPLPPILAPPLFSTRNTFTGRQNKLTGWLKAASVKSEAQLNLEAECSTDTVKQKQSLGNAFGTVGQGMEGQKKVSLAAFVKACKRTVACILLQFFALDTLSATRDLGAKVAIQDFNHLTLRTPDLDQGLNPRQESAESLQQKPLPLKLKIHIEQNSP